MPENFVYPTPIYPAPQRSIPNNGTLAAAGSVGLRGDPYSKQARVSVIVTNLSLADGTGGNLTVLRENGSVLDTVFPQTSKVYFLVEGLTLLNGSANSVEYNAPEFFLDLIGNSSGMIAPGLSEVGAVQAPAGGSPAGGTSPVVSGGGTTQVMGAKGQYAGTGGLAGYIAAFGSSLTGR